ncbi:immunoglobulin superfamily member 5 isoform X2 [Erinaceus europaeus]|uniref:immunoglobulin superfamily member 5 isoform X2 n=1 Tax=Erinaceus europaeus TaxID=9365 RepID=UPI0028FC99CB|nr:immunoglobulin superfamily member 5 isoform X2 [Erinaceus europaeus]
MDSSWESALLMLVVLAGLAAPGCGFQIVEGPSNATVVAGGQARFNCTVSQGWRLIMWALNSTVVLSITPKEPIITNDRFTSASYQAGADFVSEMLIQDVRPVDAGRVTCSLQSSDRVAWAFLSVQVVGTLAVPKAVRAVQDQPCNVTCRASGWIPLPDLSWEVGVPSSQSSSASAPDPGDPQSLVSVLTLTPQGSGTLTCVADPRGLSGAMSETVNLTVVQPGK